MSEYGDNDNNNDQQYYDDEYSGGGPEAEFENGYPDDFDQEDDGYANAGVEDGFEDGFADTNGQEGYGCDDDDGTGDRYRDEGSRGDEYQDEINDEDDDEERIKAEYEDYIRGQVEDYVGGQLGDNVRDQEQEIDEGGETAEDVDREQEEEGYDERFGYVQDQGLDDDRYPQGGECQDVEGIDEQGDDGFQGDRSPYNDMGVYNDSNDGFQYSPGDYQQDEVDENYRQGGPYEDDDIVGEGIKSYTVGVDEEYEAMEELFRQQPAEYGGGDTINDDDEDYSNTLYRPPRVRAQMRRDREASKRRSRQQRGRGPDAEERKHE